jgi:hypothetical protein
MVMAQFPFLTPLAVSLSVPLIFPFVLTWKPSFGVMRSRPPWPQVARKLTSLFPFPPRSRFPTPGVSPNQWRALLRRHHDPGFHGPEHICIIVHTGTK